MRKTFLLTTISVFGTVALFSLGAMSRTSGWAAFTKPTTPASVQNPNEAVQNIRFTVYDVALYPHELQVQAGRVALAFNDRTGKNSRFVVQRISLNAPEHVGEIPFPKDYWRSRGEVRLAPGRYRVFSPERPEIQSILILSVTIRGKLRIPFLRGLTGKGIHHAQYHRAIQFKIPIR